MFVGLPFLAKRHDTAPFEDVLKIQDNPGTDPATDTYSPLNLTGCTIRFGVTDRDGNAVMSGAATIVGLATAGTVQYQPTTTQAGYALFAADDFPLTLRAEWLVTFASGIEQRIPSGKDYRKLIVGIDLGE